MNTSTTKHTRQSVANELAKVLADTYTLYVKTQGFHWNVTGPSFPALHMMFEGQYQDLAAAADEIAERIRALGSPALGSYAQFGQLTVIKEETGVPTAENMVAQLLADHEAVAKTVLKAYEAAESIEDEASVDLLTDRLSVHEKTAWMLRSTLGK